METGIRYMPARCPAPPQMPLDGEDCEKHWAPVIAQDAGAGDNVLGEELGKIAPVVNVGILEEKVVVVPEKMVPKARGINRETRGNQDQEGHRDRGRGVLLAKMVQQVPKHID